MKIKTSELVRPALDWAVAQAVGRSVHVAGIWLINGVPVPQLRLTDLDYWNPSTDWNQGGPLLEAYKLDLGAPMESQQDGVWTANTEWGHPLGYSGPTVLIAACLAIVASVLGDEVEVPDELVA